MSDEPQLTEPLELFYSYSHKDEELRDVLETHLSMLKRQKVISQWHDRGILAGEEWGGEIDEHLKAADIILLLVSADFLASDYCYDIELKLAMGRHEAGEACVVPVILRPCDWSGAPFGKLQALPRNARPVTTWPNQDEAFTDIAKGIRKAAGALLARRKLAESNADASAGAQTVGVTKGVASQIPRPPVVGFVARRDAQGHDILGRLKEELAPENNRLIALWGPGGVGKSTLAAEFIRVTAGTFKGHVAWVSALGRSEFGLATLLDEVATQLGREDLRKLAPEAKSAQVGALVSETMTLVVLDNFETVAPEEQARCLDFLAQTTTCPALITTRSFVKRDDVYNIALAAMSMEEARDFLGRLVERTRKPSNFDRLDRDDLIRRCEANPLVLQWVVRQVDLAKRPQDVLDDLARGEGDAAERVFTRSFNLPQLGDDGRAALLALSLFIPDASREALAVVSGLGDDARSLDRAAESLSALWLIEATSGNERLFLRGLTRELAKSRLSRDGQAREFRRRYIDYFLRYAQAHSRMTQDDLDALEADRENVLSGADYAFEAQEWKSVMETHDPINALLDLHGYWNESIRSSQQAEAAARALNDSWGAAHFAACVAKIRAQRGEYEEAGRVYREVAEVFRGLGSELNVAVCLHQLGTIATSREDLREAERLYSESLEIKKRLGYRQGIANSLHELARIAQAQGDSEKAWQLFSESLEIEKEFDNQHGIAISLHALADVAEQRNDLKEARKLYNESLSITIKLGAKRNLASIYNNLGVLTEKEGDGAGAASLFRKALQLYEELGSPDAEEARANLMGIERRAASQCEE